MESSFVCFGLKGVCIDVMYNHVQKDHAAFLHPAIGELMKRNNLTYNDLTAIAVTKGPGSYTGIRVGMAAAKGLAFTLNKPFIAISNLDMLAVAMKLQHPNNELLICPMIDARRMEVFTALYDNQPNLITAPAAVILEKDFHGDYLNEKHILVGGSGAKKCCDLIMHPHLIETDIQNSHQAICKIAYERLESSNTDHLIDCEPMYLKEYQNL